MRGGDVDWSALRPETRSVPSFPVPSLQFTAMAANTLPAKNEEYGTQEYWYALILFIYVLPNHLVSQGPEIRAVSTPTNHSFAVDAMPCFVREAEDATFDWFKKYEDVAHLLHQVLPDKTARILMLGCGNSTLSEDVRFILPCSQTPVTLSQMYDDGYKNIVNVDVRPPVSISLIG